MRKFTSSIAVVTVVCGSLVLFGQESTDLAVIDRIKSEAFTRSEVMDHLRELTDTHGPRLTGSPEFDAAAKWAMNRLSAYGLSNVHLEGWGPFGRSWSVQQYSVEMVTPGYAQLAAMPLAWSRSTDAPVIGEPILAPLDSNFFQSPARQAATLAEYQTRWRGKLRGKIILTSANMPLSPRERPLFARFSDADLAELAKAPKSIQSYAQLDDIPWPDNVQDVARMVMSMPDVLLEQLMERLDQLALERTKFFVAEGVAAVLVSDERGRGGASAAEAAGSYRARDPLAPPTFVVTAEHYGRIARLVERKQPVSLRINLKANVSSTDVQGANIIAELPGTQRDEVVMIGAHFDSWHSATGATDNAAGSAVMIEVMRILKALDMRLGRTVRIALWGGEEQGLLGSRAYVKAHFAGPATLALLPAHDKLSGYFNLDNGSGRIRGVYLQGHEAMRPIFEQWFAPFRDLGVTTTTIRDTGATDHLVFTRVGLPGFQFIQDPLNYESETHHTSADTFDHVVAEDLKQASAVIASVVYHAAMRPERLPRRPRASPEPRRVTKPTD
jgi:carboxypeptidase Q